MSGFQDHLNKSSDFELHWPVMCFGRGKHSAQEADRFNVFIANGLIFGWFIALDVVDHRSNTLFAHIDIYVQPSVHIEMHQYSDLAETLLQFFVCFE